MKMNAALTSLLVAIVFGLFIYRERAASNMGFPDSGQPEKAIAKRNRSGLPSGFSQDLKDMADRYVLTVHVPFGITDPDVDVGLLGRQLTISIHANRADEGSDNQFRYRGEYNQSLTLPEAVAADKITFKLNDGVLTVVVPKQQR